MDAPIGSIYSDTAGGVGSTFYAKEVAGAGAGNWNPMGGGAPSSDNWVASGTTNSSLPGRAYMDSVQVTNNKTGTGALMFADTPTVTNSLTIRGGTVTTDLPAFKLDQIWNAGGTTFNGMLVNITNTASAAASKLFDVQLGGTSFLNLRVDGRLLAAGNVQANQFHIGTGGSSFSAIASTLTLGNDTIITKDSTAVLQLGTDAASPINQTLKAHDATGTDKSGANLTLKGGYGTGTGRGGDLITMTSVSSNTTGAVVQYYSTRHYESAKPAPVTNSTASPLFNILINTNHYLACKIFASTFASDVGGDFQAFAEELNVSAVNKAGTIASTVSTSWGTNLAASSASTLTTTWTAVTSGNSLDIKITPVSSLTPTTYYTKWKVDVLSNDPATITPQ